MGVTDGEVEREVYPSHPVFKLWCRIYGEIVGIDHVFSQTGKFLRQFGQLRVHRAEITLYATFEAQRHPLYVEGVSCALMGKESMVGDMLTELLTVHVEI